MYAHRIVCFARALHGGYVIDQFVLDGTTRRGGVAAARAAAARPWRRTACTATALARITTTSACSDAFVA
jgi:hypothetical protein